MGGDYITGDLMVDLYESIEELEKENTTQVNKDEIKSLIYHFINWNISDAKERNKEQNEKLGMIFEELQNKKGKNTITFDFLNMNKREKDKYDLFMKYIFGSMPKVSECGPVQETPKSDILIHRYFGYTYYIGKYEYMCILVHQESITDNSYKVTFTLTFSDDATW